MRTKLFKSFLVLSLLILGIGNAWAGTTYYSALKAQVSSGSPSGSGKVYAGTSNTAGTYVEGTSTSSSQSSSTKDDAKTFYAFAQANEGYSFTGWSTSNGGPIVSTNNPYQVTVNCSSSKSNSPTTTTVYANFVQNQSVNVTFIPATNGSYTVKGTKITSSQSITCEGATNLVATPASGYKFFGWYTSTDGGTTKNYFAHSASVSYTFLAAATVYAEFIPSSVATFMVKGTSNYYYDFAKGLTAASSSSSKVLVVASDGSVSAGNYTIPSGVTLLIPFDAGYTLKTTAPTYENNDNTVKSRVLFRQLTLVSGANITINGSLSVGGNLHARNGGQMTACVLDNYGRLHMESGSNIVLNGNLYCWGYITGNGSINAKSGSNVYEPFQMDFRGGTHCSNTYKTAFPMAQYYVQNIEAPITFHYGATETLFTCCYAQYSLWDGTASFIGSNGLFRLESGATLTRHYDGVTDRQCYDLYGNASIQDISVSVSVMKMASKEYILPINNNMILTIHSGKTTIYYDLALLPDSRIIIEDGATVEIKKNIYIYDKSDWRADETGYTYTDSKGTHKSYFAVGADINLVPYSPTKTGSRTSAGLTDAHVVVNGTLKTLSSNGKIYTTTHGADICSDGGGKIVYGVVPTSTSSFKQGISTASKVQDIPVTSAQLHNSAAFKTTYGADFEYLATAGAAANTTITYANGHWGWVGIWKDYNGNTLKTANTCLESQLTSTTAPSYTSSYSDGCFEYTGTSTTATSTWTATEDTAKQEVVYTPVYASTAKTYTVTFLAGANGTGSVEAGTKTCGVDMTLSNSTFTRDGYLQTGWSTQDGGAKAYELGGNYTADAAITLYPFWTMNTFTITWKSENGSITLQTDENQNAGTPTAFNGDTPNKDATAQYTYTFDGWTTAANGGGTFYANGATPVVSANATYYAHFSAATNTYTVTWKNVNNVILETDENVPYGTMPTYDGETPAHPDYVDNIRWDRPFEGWTPAIGNVTGNVEYTAAYGSETAKTYTIIWQDYDGTELARSTANYGWNWPEYPGVTPQRSDAKVNYTFIGWTEPATSLVAGNAIFTAVYRGDIEVAENEQKIIAENTVVTTATIRALGRIEVANAAKLTTENLIIEAAPNKSGEVVVSGDMEVTGEAYFDFEVNSDDWHWNAFGVPFEIDLTEHAPLLERTTPMTLGYDYDIVYYNAQTRATQGAGDRCWDYVQHHGRKLIPGKMYLIVFNHHLPHVDVIRFTKASGKPVDYTEEVPLTVTGTGINDNWNGISNPKMYHALLDAGVTECQVHDGGAIGEDAYIMHNMNNKKFFVGKAAFVQSPASQSVVIATPATTQLPIVAQAPHRAAAEAAIDHYDVQIASEYTDLDDRIYVITAEEKEDKYVIVADLAKAGVSKARAQMWVNRYGTKLCKNTTELVDYQANYPLGIFAPAEGNYDLFIDEQPNDGSMLYLTLDGEAIWNLSYGGYTVWLEEGTTNRYGLRVVAKAPQITTPIEEVTIENGETIRKIISGDMIYIIRNGETYTITGQKK